MTSLHEQCCWRKENASWVVLLHWFSAPLLLNTPLWRSANLAIPDLRVALRWL